jgi:hypothetical protein
MSKLFQKIKKWISGLTSVLLIAGVLSPAIVGAADVVSLETPYNLSPANGAYITTANLTEIDWSDVVSDAEVVTYNYQVSYSIATSEDGAFVTPLATMPVTESRIDASSTAEGAYYWHVQAVVLANGTTSAWSKPWKLDVDNTAPVLTAAMISSNGVSPDWAKPGDTVYVKVLGDEVIDGVDATINGRAANLVSYGEGFKAYRVMDASDVDGLVTFSINYTDLAGNPGAVVETTTDVSSVTFDKTAPELFASKADYSAKYPLTGKALASQNYLEETDIEPTDGVFVVENTRIVDVRTVWEIDKTKSLTLPVYKVTYIAEDQAGNLVSVPLTKEIALKVGTADSKAGNIQPTLKGLSLLVPNAERGNVYTDEGVTLNWTTSVSAGINVWAYGDLNLSKVTTQDGHQLSEPYILGYRAHDEADPTHDLNKKAEREINVEDTVGPGAVTGLTAYAGNGYVQLSWVNPASDDLAGLDVYRSTVLGQKGVKIASALSKDATSYDDYTVVNGVTYYYTVVAFDLYANNSKDSLQVSALPMAPKVAAVTTDYYYDDGAKEIVEEQEVKSDETVEPDEDVKTESAVPVIGIIILILLIVLGLYLLYLQNPEWFRGLAFWKRRKDSKNQKPKK